MSQRRMFSKIITSSARFLKMPMDSQVLYFHLGMNADDDGVVEAYSVMKMLGNTEDNLKVLVAKGFVKILNDDLVTFIIDWQEHNLIRADRKVDSIYKDLLLMVVPEIELMTPKPRADTKKLTGRPVDGTWTPQVRVGKGRVGKDKIIYNPKFFEEFWEAYPKKKAKPNAEKSWKKLNPDLPLKVKILKDIQKQKNTEDWKKQNGQFTPYPATYINQERWNDEDSKPNNNKKEIYYGKK